MFNLGIQKLKLFQIKTEYHHLDKHLHLFPDHLIAVISEHKTLETEPGLDQQEDRDQHPQSIKEDQVDPQVEPAGCVKMRTAEQPVRTEGHPAAVQLTDAQSNLQEMSDMHRRQVNIMPCSSKRFLKESFLPC